MTINPEINGILSRFGVPVKDGLTFLLALYFDTMPSYIPVLVEEKLKRSGIYSLNDNNKVIQWNIPLFGEQFTNFEWVRDWKSLFERANKIKTCSLKDATSRMMKFFASNPDIRKDEVIGATEMYIKATDSKFLMLPHYFINKGSGKDTTHTLSLWVEKYREAGTEHFNGRTTHNTVMK